MILTTKFIDDDKLEQDFSKYVEMCKDVKSLQSRISQSKFNKDSLWDICKENKDRAIQDCSKYKLSLESNDHEYMIESAKRFLIDKKIISKNQQIIKSGDGVYTPGCYMGWHTNRCTAGIRCYFNWASKSDKSGLMYWYEGTKKIIRNSVDQYGWQLRMFSTDYPKPFWHSVWSNCTRLSIGFRILE